MKLNEAERNIEDKELSLKNTINRKTEKAEETKVKITFKRILIYFIIYSFLGFVVETIFGMLTKGVIESRRSCLYGPFCCIYG